MSRFNCTDCCLNDTESCRYGANKSKDYSECCPDLLVEQNVAYEKALKDLSKKINETFWQFQGAEGSRNRLLLDKIIEDLKEGKEE